VKWWTEEAGGRGRMMGAATLFTGVLAAIPRPSPPGDGGRMGGGTSGTKRVHTMAGIPRWEIPACFRAAAGV
jgi:hypothetical protein